jgi:hypothetical protein
MMTYKYSLRSGSKKDICPSCNKKTFVPYIQTETGNEVAIAGRCDRESNCGYFKKPEDNEAITSPKFEAIEIKTDYIPLQQMQDLYCLGSYNSFSKFLQSKFNFKEVFAAEQMYFLTGSNRSVIFWQIDQLERIRSGKIMEYNPQTGKRLKDANGKAYISWAHKKPYNLKQCLFGLHLFNDDRTKDIAIVESEKTAVIMSIKEPRLTWMACGSLNGFKVEYLAPLRLRKIFGFPDKGCFGIWSETADKLNDQGFNIEVSDLIENSITLSNGDDLADLYL